MTMGSQESKEQGGRENVPNIGLQHEERESLSADLDEGQEENDPDIQDGDLTARDTELDLEDSEPIEKNFARFAELYTEGKKKYQAWEESRRDNIWTLRVIADEIQHVEFAGRVGQITYSSVGVVSAGLTIAGIALLPFTFGTSLGLTVAGAATGVTSGVASLTHTSVNIGLTKKKSKSAKELLEMDAKKTEELREIVGDMKTQADKIRYKLKRGAQVTDENPKQPEHGEVYSDKQLGVDLLALGAHGVANGKLVYNLVSASMGLKIWKFTGVIDDVAEVIGLGVIGGKFVPNIMKENVRGVARVGSRFMIPLVAVTAVMDVATIVRNAHSLDKKELCHAAQKLQAAAEDMQKELEAYEKCFTGEREEKEQDEEEVKRGKQWKDNANEMIKLEKGWGNDDNIIEEEEEEDWIFV